MKTEDDYIDYKLEKAQQSLEAAELLFNNNFFADSLSKIYYAVFYAVSAWLTKKKLNPKTHQGVKSLFHKEFIYTGNVSKEQGEFFDMLQAKRFEVDYEDYPFINEEKLPQYLENAKALIALIKTRIKNS
ncbi:HEPN domain-containing protein [Parafilimonas sp.]|uniref:HEPN domain-containing protein n=1 Tax=Parafilimonas sp. TaxID=1969739 RepID=UPI0039E58EB1